MHHRSPSRRHAKGFTLVEVLISITLVLLIILGVNQVFAMTSQVVSTGQVLSTINRDARSVQSVLYRDLGSAEIDRAPFFIINSESLAAFRNVQDQLSDLDFEVSVRSPLAAVDNAIRTIDRNENGAADDPATPRAFMTSRTRRADQLIFFSRSPGRRQTGDSGSFTSGVSSSEKYIWYGHLRQPKNDTNESVMFEQGLQPGIQPNTGSSAETPATNPNNYYATQWVLGRAAMLLREPEVSGAGAIVYDYSTNPARQARYIGRPGTPHALAPFSEGSQATTNGTDQAGARLEWSHTDLIGTSMDRYRLDFLPFAIANGGANWSDPLVFRFAGFPTPPRPLDPRGVARTVPCLVQHCTQFAVEYAGDFLSQNSNDGAVTGVVSATGGNTDGEIDYIVQNYTINGQTQKSRRIRWYGFPRDTHGAVTTSAVAADVDRPDGFIYAEDDVVPLRDLVGGQGLPFEKAFPTASAPPPTPGSPRPASPNYGAGPNTIPAPIRGPQATSGGGGTYRCVWTPSESAQAGYPRPSMIRITMAIDDPTGRVGEEQFFEFIIELPR